MRLRHVSDRVRLLAAVLVVGLVSVAAVDVYVFLVNTGRLSGPWF